VRQAAGHSVERVVDDGEQMVALVDRPTAAGRR